MTNDEIINQIIQQMPLASVSINICDAATRAAKASLSYKDNQPISELGGWHTEPPTEDCTVLLLIQGSNICIWEVATWNNDKRYFQSLHSNFIAFWTKWKLI